MKRRVLVIDDDTWFAESVARYLTNAGYGVSLAVDAVQGMKHIDESHPDVIVLDFFMPGPNGIVLLHELQSHSDLATIPVVLCTNSATDFAPEDLKHYGVYRVLDKTTMEPSDVVAAIRKALA